jgi:hypothetical protein
MPEIFRTKMRPVARVGAPVQDLIRLQPDAGSPRPLGTNEATIDATFAEANSRIAVLDRDRGSRLAEISRELGLGLIVERRAPSLGAAGDTVSMAVERTDAKMWLWGAEVVRTVDGAGSFFTLYTADAAAIFWVKCRPEGGSGVYLAEIHTGQPVTTTVSVQSAEGASQSMVTTPGTECLRAVFELAPTSAFTLALRPQAPLRVFRVDVTRLS